MRILLGLFIMTFWGCSNSTIKQEGLALDKQTPDNYESNVSIVNGKFVINTNAILNNNNLQSLIDELEKTDLTEKKTVAEIPPFIKSFLDTLTGSFSIADPGEDWQVGCTSLTIIDKEGNVTSDEKPKRQLIYFGSGSDITLLTYYTGGIGKSEHILIFKYNDDKILDFWCGNISTDVAMKTEIINYLKANKDKDWGLNTNIIYL